MYLRRRCVVELIEKIVAQAEHRSSSTGRVVAQRLEQEEKSSPSTRPIRRAEGTRVIGSLGREFESRRLFQCSSTDVSGAHGRGRAPPGPVAQQRSTERGVAARLPMPDEGRSVRGDDVETRVRIPPARAPSSSTSTTLASSSPLLAHASARADGRGLPVNAGSSPASSMSSTASPSRAGRRISVIPLSEDQDTLAY